MVPIILGTGVWATVTLNHRSDTCAGVVVSQGITTLFIARLGHRIASDLHGQNTPQSACTASNPMSKSDLDRIYRARPSVQIRPIRF